MKNNVLLTAFATLMFASLLGPLTASAESSGFSTNGNVTVKASDKTEPLDPEDPLKPVDPGESPSTEGDLRIDFVSAINFAEAEITKTNRIYPSLAQLFYGDTPARGTYVQVTDLREGTPGWSLQLKQNTQFKNNDSIELNGARLSFDKGWANSGGTGIAPSVFRDTISVDEIGSSYQVATAAKGAGNGTWLMSFGASEANENNQENSLTPLKGKDGKAVTDSLYNKQAYSNSAITLSVPDKTDILPGDYQTELTWILQATP
ncbi:WxL domain-containing protein [Vagococcus sp. BWB3-3]|uniref:WxL domain-containing protein n=1 Tax=Vagococcus allomyrinae TaxID=2794353 RepID=A0A940P936_9ENTE|nr:WxL domain-containing protein [Vagococcus allomyrinae]MBP1043597.1 WxL domain-containing protein [Vagococcus allomyrinae]